MFPETSESKSESSDRLRPVASEATLSAATLNTVTKTNLHDEMQNKSSYSVNKQQMVATALHQRYLNYFNSNIPKEETKSHSRNRNGISNSLSQHPKAALSNQDQLQSSQISQSIANQRNHNIKNNPGYVYHIPSNIYSHQQNNHHSNNYQINNMSRSVPMEESPISHRFLQQNHLQQHQHQHQHQQQQQQPPQAPPHTKTKTYSTGALSRDTTSKVSASSLTARQEQQQHQLDRDSEETATTIKEEITNDLQGCKMSELEAISSLERNLPIELSFLIRQQAHCMARMNYLDRQIRELKEAAHSQQQVDTTQVSSTSMLNQGHPHRPASNIVTNMTHAKNGNFILSDDSGGEYSRATISDDDELSSLLDQIAKSVRPEQRTGSSVITNNYNQFQQHQQQQLQLQQQQQQQQRIASSCGAIISTQQQTQQPYAIINPNQLHHQQAVPIFVMGSPIAVAHPSSISSNILPGVHFQPEPRYNQYYEDFYYQNGNNCSNNVSSSMITPPVATMQRHGQSHNQNGRRSQQFDNSISVIEQLVSQKEKRQIISQLKSADNWLKMRTSNNSNQQSSLRSKQQSSTDLATQEADTLTGDMKRTAPPASSIKKSGDCVINDKVGE